MLSFCRGYLSFPDPGSRPGIHLGFYAASRCRYNSNARFAAIHPVDNGYMESIRKPAWPGV